jgi:sortase (surface protein transpeptidase)
VGPGSASVPASTPLQRRSAPISLRIPVINLSAPVSELGLNADRTVEVPTDFARPGWFRMGPSPGQLGSAVILGHVDSYSGPAVFYELRTLRQGDGVEVALADGAVARFVVTGVAMYPKADFPSQRVYASNGGAALNLVTCGGEFDRSIRSYLSNVVVYTALVGTTPPASGN